MVKIWYNIFTMMQALVVIFGAAAGSFLNVVVWRLHTGHSIVRPRSFCPNCKTPLRWYDNIPLLSFILLTGRCRYCHKPISWFYPFGEGLTALLFLALYLRFGLTPQAAVFAFFSSFLVVLFIYDLRYYIIPDEISLSGIGVAVLLQWYLGAALQSLLLAGIIAAGFFGLQYIFSGGRWIGGGDIRLGALMGAMLGWPQVLVALFLAYLLGSVIGVSLVLGGRKQWSSKVPFGTFLTAATFVSFLYGPEILNWYLSWLG